MKMKLTVHFVWPVAFLAACASPTAIVPNGVEESPIEFGVRLTKELSSGLDKLIVGNNTKIIERLAVRHMNVHFIPYQSGIRGVIDSYRNYCALKKGTFTNGACFGQGDSTAPLFIVDARKAAYGKSGAYVELNVMEPTGAANPDEFVRDTNSLVRAIPWVANQKAESYRNLEDERRQASFSAWAKAIQSGCTPFDTICIARYHYANPRR